MVASRRFLLHCFNGSSVGGSRVGRSREVGRFLEGSLGEVSLYIYIYIIYIYLKVLINCEYHI